MNILLDSLPYDIEIDGVRYAIDASYRCMIRFELMMQDNAESDEAKIFRSLCEFYVDRVPENVLSAIDKMVWFYQCGKENDDNVQRKARDQRQVYSFEYDADMIYAAFFDQYGIDLQKENLHWWKFKAMFRALREQNEFVKIMGYRCMNIPNSMSREQKEFYRKMKEIHKLQPSRAECEKLREIERILMGDGKL